MKKIRLIIELTILYIILPIIYILFFKGISLIPFLILLGIISYSILHFDKTFNFKDTLSYEKVKNIKQRTIVFFITSIAAAIFIYFNANERFLYLVFELSYFTIFFPILYTLFSVLPQTLFFRTLFFHRYSQLFKSKKHSILISSILFSYSHIVLLNLPAIILTLIGGLVFSFYYSKDKSTLASILEHGAYGSILFVLGFGIYLYSGA